MGRVIYDISMSLDGSITGANPHAAEGWAALGEGGARLHDWAFENPEPHDLAIMENYALAGANIFGRAGYDHSILNWGANGPSGAARIPTIIVSHSVPNNVPNGHVYTFVNSIDAAFETAKKLAGDKDIIIMGSNVAQQFLKRGLIDEVSIHLVPAIFGSGTRLFEGFDGQHVELEPIEVVKTAGAIHLRFSVVK